MNQSEREILSNLAKAAGITDADALFAMDVVQTGDKVIIPENAYIPDVIENLQREFNSQEQAIVVRASVDVPIWDGALALQKAIKDELGLVIQKTDWFSGGAAEIQIETSLGKTESIKWGKFQLPAMGEDAYAETGFNRDMTGKWTFSVTIRCKRKYEARAHKVTDRMRHYAMTESVHKGKSFSVRYKDDDGDLLSLPVPKFFPLAREKPIFKRVLETGIERNILTPIRYADELAKAGYSLKRGILFVGPYGTGKTMTASYIAGVANENGWTFIYVKESSELPYALRDAQRLQPCVVFAEDGDRVAGEDRTDDVNDLLNELDGIDSKSAKIITILTSNHGDIINDAMRRPGRIDALLEISAPDAEAVDRMLREFAGTQLERDADLSEVSHIMAGFPAAHVREVVKRAQLEALRRSGNVYSEVTGGDLAAVALEVVAENAMFRRDDKADADTPQAIADGFWAMANTLTAYVESNSRTSARH